MAKFLTILLAEAAIETFPEELLKDVKVRQYLSKLKKPANELLLDMSFHSHLMEGLHDAEKRGRPDITHFALLSCFGSIMARDHRLNVIIHTYHNKVINLHQDIRLPKNIDRFNGLLIQLFKEKQVPPESQKPLMTLSDSTLSDLVSELRDKHDQVIEFSVKGEQMSSSEYSELIYKATNPLLIFGAYPQGKLKGLDDDLVDKKIAIYEEGLDLFAVISQILASQQMIEEKHAKLNIPEQEKLSWE
jgi:rRNA small subunit pseudouridine methyltransferase Nep1